jgi:sialate O-acetylesterase
VTGRLLCAALFLVAVQALPSNAFGGALSVAGPFGDHMVLQRGAVVPIRGSATPVSPVIVTIGGRRYEGRADAHGGWSVALQPMKPGAQGDLTIESEGERLHFQDVVAGDVWVCSGQSNMEWSVADSLDGEREIAGAHDQAIRQFKVPRSWAASPEESLAGGSWETAEPEHAGGFTGVGYFFARELRPRIDVPIGLINTTWGGSRIEPWMSAASLALSADEVGKLLAQERDFERAVLEKLRARIGDLPTRDAGLVEGRALWADPELDDAGWERIKVPSAWEDSGFNGMDGVAWYRTSFVLTPDEAHRGVRLGLGTIDDSDISWVNGHEVGRTTLAWNRARVYEVPPAFLSVGRNVVAVRVEDDGGGGGIWGKPELLFVEVGGDRRPLAGEWRFRPAVVTVNMDFHKNQVPTVLYNKMVHPLLSYSIKGVLWYQGESNASPADAVAYRKLFPAMIDDWRAGWGLGNVPFLFVQLANYLPGGAEPPESGWALLRESQAAALGLPATAQVVTIDIGDAHDIHPRNKQEVGRRLALAARKIAYGEDLVFSGPAYRGHEVRGRRVVLTFAHVGHGLMAKGADEGRLTGFTIAGDDRRFVPAEARLEGSRVVVWSAAVRRPVAVRYAWADDPEEANLFNVDGLPASPFRTDAWEE